VFPFQITIIHHAIWWFVDGAALVHSDQIKEPQSWNKQWTTTICKFFAFTINPL
jgi:hypothetical protein